jgi:hypothetical protein
MPGIPARDGLTLPGGMRMSGGANLGRGLPHPVRFVCCRAMSLIPVAYLRPSLRYLTGGLFDSIRRGTGSGLAAPEWAQCLFELSSSKDHIEQGKNFK